MSGTLARMLRENKGQNIVGFAESTGLHPQTVLDNESRGTGRVDPKYALLVKIMCDWKLKGGV